MVELDKWYETDKYGSEITHIMYGLFEEWTDSAGEGVASVKFKNTNGEVLGWYHPPRGADIICDPKYQWRTNDE